ncbi:hypothetical protein HB901_09950, partial [Listeria booriae]|uniref:beta strand repeat-containing protein n=1 Tax=Listeria booriae TaxID=1552123 RepID=UPI0018032536
MTNKKRANKLAKITVASAIALSALAQPLGTLVTVKAAEAPATKAESKLLQSNIGNENTGKNLKATKVSIENPNFKIDEASMSVPGWKFGGRSTDKKIFYNIPLIKDPINFDQAGWYRGTTPPTGGTLILRDYRSTGIEMAIGLDVLRETVMYQNIKTVPGEEYTFSLPARTGSYYMIRPGGFGIKAYDVNSESLISSDSVEAITTSNKLYSTRFTARSNETRIELVARVLNGSLSAYADVSLLFDGGSTITPTDTTPPDAPTVIPVYNTDTTIKGSGEANCDVTVTLESGDVVTGRTDANGNFNITIPAQAAGKRIKVTLTDGAGNESNPTTVTVLAKSVAAPTINTVTTDDTTVKGTGIPGQRVYYKVGSADWYEYRYATVGADGTYSFLITNQPAGTLISVKHTVGGIDSTVATTTVIQGSVAAPTINGVKSDDTTVKGTGIPGATVTVTIAGQDRTATVGQDGNYSVIIPAQAVGTVITAKQTLNNKTSNPVSTTVTQGTVADPTINPVTTDSTSVKGTGVNGATVTITIGSNTYTGTVSGGEYTITIPKQAAGTVISAKQSLNSQTSNSVNTTVTQGELAAPVINTVTSDDTTVTGTGMKSAVVTLTINNQDYTGLVDDNGAYSITIDKQPAGTIITAKQEINAKTSTNATTTVTQGTVTPPVVNPVTTDDTIVTGTGMKGATVKLAIGGIDYTGLVNENGTYAIAILKQPVGTIITATETLGGTTSAATIATVTQGTVAAPTINSLTTADTIVRGTGITGAVVTITIGSNTYTGTVTAGEYAITIPNQPVGTVVSAKQTLNNKTSGSVNTTVTQGAIAAPTINGVTTDSTTVTGTGLAGATVTVTIGSTPYTGTVAANGSYSITIPKQAFGTAITVKQTLNNKTSANASTTVTQGTVAAPTVGAVTTDDTTVKGTGLAGATVTVTIGSTPYTGTVAANGSYSITIPKQAFGTAITVKQTLNNKTSANASTTVTQGTVAAPTVGA